MKLIKIYIFQIKRRFWKEKRRFNMLVTCLLFRYNKRNLKKDSNGVITNDRKIVS